MEILWLVDPRVIVVRETYGVGHEKQRGNVPDNGTH